MRLLWRRAELEYALDNRRWTVGRSPHNDITVPDPLVSSNHGVIENGVLTDCDSTNGTIVNGAPLAPRVPLQLKPGDVILFGDTVFAVARLPSPLRPDLRL